MPHHGAAGAVLEQRSGTKILIMQRPPSIHEVLAALDWVRREMMHRGSPDFIRQRELEARVRRLASRLARGRGSSRRAVGVKPRGVR